MADIVLPATTFLEHDDLYLAGGHTFLQVGAGGDRTPGGSALQPLACWASWPGGWAPSIRAST